jgi:hypothetical protein
MRHNPEIEDGEMEEKRDVKKNVPTTVPVEVAITNQVDKRGVDWNKAMMIGTLVVLAMMMILARYMRD